MTRTLALLTTPLFLLSPFAGCKFKTFDHKRAEMNHLRSIGLCAENYEFTYKVYPTAIDTDEFAKHLGDSTLDDEWGTIVKYRLTNDGYVVTSAGPDKKHNSNDDLTLTSAEIKNWNQ